MAQQVDHHFRDLVRADGAVTTHLDEAALAEVFDLAATVANVEAVFDRLHTLVPEEIAHV